MIADDHRVAGAVARPRTGWPEAVAHLRLPRIVACGFPALRPSEIDLQQRALLFVRVLLPWGLFFSLHRRPSSRCMEPMFPTNDSTSAGRFPT